MYTSKGGSRGLTGCGVAFPSEARQGRPVSFRFRGSAGEAGGLVCSVVAWLPGWPGGWW